MRECFLVAVFVAAATAMRLATTVRLAAALRRSAAGLATLRWTPTRLTALRGTATAGPCLRAWLRLYTGRHGTHLGLGPWLILRA